MSKKAGIAMITLGAVLILSALLLFVHNRRESDKAGQEAAFLLSAVESRIQEQTPTVSPAAPDTGAEALPSSPAPSAAPEITPVPEMPVARINGYDFVGYLELPTLGLKLPVLAKWDYSLLQVAPCRQHGSVGADDLVIAAHNYSTHFGRLKELSAGDTVIFTDMDGVVTSYSVSALDTVDPYDVDHVLNSGHDLVLYTCTVGGQTRVTVFCDRMTEPAAP